MIIDEIRELQEKMNALIECRGLLDPFVKVISQELDKLINEFYTN